MSGELGKRVWVRYHSITVLQFGFGLIFDIVFSVLVVVLLIFIGSFTGLLFNRKGDPPAKFNPSALRCVSCCVEQTWMQSDFSLEPPC
jgi:hypothetical protein